MFIIGENIWLLKKKQSPVNILNEKDLEIRVTELNCIY
jgi:hypothetical protein